MRSDVVLDFGLYGVARLLDRDRCKIGVAEEVVDNSDVLRAHLHRNCHVSQMYRRGYEVDIRDMVNGLASRSEMKTVKSLYKKDVMEMRLPDQRRKTIAWQVVGVGKKWGGQKRLR